MHFNKGKAYGRQGKAPKGVKFQHSILLIFERQIYRVFVSFILYDRDFNLMTSFLISFCDKF